MTHVSFLIVTPLVVAMFGNGTARTQRIAWVRQGAAPVLAESATELPAGTGCAAVVGEGTVPAWLEATLPHDGRRLATFHPRGTGTWLHGAVVTEDLATYVPEVRLAPSPGTMPELCWQALAALGWDRWQVDRGGTFAVGPLPSGRWQVTVSAPSHRLWATDLEVPAEPIEKRLPTVRLAPVGRLHLDLRVVGEGPFTLSTQRVNREAGGRLRFEDSLTRELRPAEVVDVELDPGQYRLVLRDGNVVPLWVEPVDVAVGEQTVTVTPKVVDVEGRVLQGDRPVAAARLVLALAPQLTAETASDTEGRFTVRLPRPDKFLLEVHLPDGRWHHAFLDLRDAVPGDRAHRDIQVPSRWLAGRVVTTEGEAVASASVVYTLTQKDRKGLVNGTTTADPDGRFAVPLEEGSSLEVRVRRQGFLPANISWTDLPPEEVVVVLERGVEVEGLVVDASGRPVPQAQVVVPQGPFEAPRISDRTGSDGHFRLTVPPGSVLLAWAPGAGVGWAASHDQIQILLLPPAPPSPLSLQTADRAPLARGQVAFVTGDGVAVPAGVFSAMQRASGGFGSSDPDGRLAVLAVPEGAYTLLCRDRQGRTFHASVVLPASGPLTLTP